MKKKLMLCLIGLDVVEHVFELVRSCLEALVLAFCFRRLTMYMLQ